MRNYFYSNKIILELKTDTLQEDSKDVQNGMNEDVIAANRLKFAQKLSGKKKPEIK